MGLKVHILHDNRRQERYDNYTNELERQGVTEYEVFPCILSKTVVESINTSFRMIVQKAKDEGLKECCIWEDDNYFPSEKGWDYFLSNKPKEYDLYIGGSYLKDNRIEYVSPIVKVNSYVGNHCIIIHEKYYDTFLSTPTNEHIDTAQDKKGDFYLCYPMAALQRSGFSSNNMAVCDYNAILEEKDIYK